jgi:hypothetical protein
MSDPVLTRACPVCRRTLVKAVPTESVVCACGWVWT